MNKFNPMIKPSQKRAASLLLGLALTISVSAVALVGCGSGSGSSSLSSSAVSSATGRATLTITWPERTTSRLIPVASNSITVAFFNGTTQVATQTVARPTSGNTSTLSFASLPAGSLTMAAAAYPTTDGTGTAQANASKSVTITANTTSALAITMASTIVSLSVTPSAPSVAVGSTVTLVATPQDGNGATVLAPNTLTFTSSNASVATVTSAGVVTGAGAGSATITVGESESGKSASATVTVTAVSTGTGISDLALAYYNTLSTAQKTATLVASNATNAAKWINLPATPSSDGTQSQRNGVSYSTLTTAQKTAWNNLVNAVLAGQPLTQYNGIRAADYYLGSLSSGYSGDFQYIGFVGTPSSTGTWLLQIGGHHIAHNYYYTGNTLNTTTPYFLGVEPTSFTYNSTAYTPLSAQSTAVAALLKSFTTTQLTAAKLSSGFSDVYIGPGKDARSNFPTGTTGRGMLASNLTTAQQTLLKNVIAAWTQDSPLATTYQSLYESELSSTYVAYSGNSSAPTTVFTANGDYIRVDGPHVWIEFVCQSGIVIQGQIHYHTIWRDRVSDYNAAYGF